MSRNQVFGFLIALTLQKTDANQLLNDTGTGRRSSQTFSLDILRHFICTGCFHSRKQRILGKVFRGRSFSFLDFRTKHLPLVPNGYRRKCLFVFVVFCRRTLLNQSLPSVLHDGFALCGERCAAAVQFNDCLCVSVWISHCNTQPIGNQLQNCKFTRGKFAQIAFLQFSGRNDGMVICDLFVIHNLLCMNWYVIHILHGECVESQLYEVGQAMCHIFRQKPAVGTGISDQFLFIEVLRVVQGLLCRVAKHTVGFSL